MSSDYRLNIKYEGHNHSFDLEAVTPDKGDVTLNGVRYALHGSSEDHPLMEIFLKHLQSLGAPTIEVALESVRHIASVEEVSIAPIAKTHAVALASLGMTSAKSIALQKCIEEDFRTDIPGGCSVVVMKEGEILFSHSVGGHSLDSRQHFGSVSKQFTAACILDLVHKGDGKLRLDQDIRDFLPLPPFTHAGKPVIITVDNLLQMQSGLPTYGVRSFLEGKGDGERDEKAEIAFLDPSKPFELFDEPGTEFCYCTTNYLLLADIVRVASGKPTEDGGPAEPEKDLRTYAHESVFTPCGMASTDFIEKGRPTLEQSIPGYSGTGEEKTTINQTWGSCGVLGTARDMVRWDGEGPKTPYWKDLTAEPPKGSSYARGFHVFYPKGREGRYRAVAHVGHIDGFNTSYLRLEEKDSTQIFSVFIATNRNHDMFSLNDKVTNLFSGEEVMEISEPREPSPLEVSYDGPAMQSSAGTYRCADLTIPHVLEVVEFKGKPALKMTPAGASDEFSLFFAPALDNPQKYLAVDGSPTDLMFSAEGFTFTDPQNSIRLSFHKES